YQSLEKNRKLLKSDKIRLFNQDALVFLKQKSTKTFDFVLLDPPFNKNLISKTLKSLKNSDFVTSKSKIYIESEFEITQDFLKEKISEKIEIIKQKQSGAVNYCLLKIL
ncbi:MAG: 16S rRNA (guanine(966)-N(2))-methyltransferase RsmD, partial [Candidatus Ruthia sp.]|nr:16S rRNA (guanine(966)-N(2))-methyltransferase RsmD [Candidatus Ruthturnera sp.]